MSAEPVNGSSEMPVKHLVSLVGNDVVLLPCDKGVKGARESAWQKTTIEKMRNPDYIRELECAGGIAVLTGKASNGLCSIDIDDDEMVEPFLALNPKLRETLRSRGRRGCNLWVRIDGAYPRPCVIKQADGSAWGEWRSTGYCTMIHGLHPEGMTYTRSPEVPPVTMRFEDIQWPEDLILTWMNTCDEIPGEVPDQFPSEDEEPDDDLIRRYGAPVYYSETPTGGIYVSKINEPYWAALYASEHIMLYEPDERNFYQYEHETGLYSIISPDVIKQVISHRMLLISRTKPILDGLEKLRTDHLNERFELFRFQRRTLLVGVDVNKDFLQSKGAPVIKALCGGDWLDAEQKGGTGSFQFQGKFNILMTSNARLQVSLQGDVGAWKRRMLIVRYESPPPKRIIFDFADVLIREEGPGILNWMLEGLQLLLKDIEETGTIRLTDRQKGIVDSLLAESDSLRLFLTNRVRRQDGSDLTVNEIVQAYAGYCPEMGWQPMKDSQIGYQLASLMLELFQTVKSNSCQREGKAARGFRGVAFINPEDEP